MRSEWRETAEENLRQGRCEREGRREGRENRGQRRENKEQGEKEEHSGLRRFVEGMSEEGEENA